MGCVHETVPPVDTWSSVPLGRGPPLGNSMGHTSEVAPHVGSAGAEVSLHALPFAVDHTLLGWTEERVAPRCRW